MLAMFWPRLSVSLYFVFLFHPKLTLSQFSAQILSQNARIQRLCSEMSTTCARSCQSFIGQCNLNVISPPIPETTPFPQMPQTPDPISMSTVPGLLSPPAIEQRCWPYRQNFLQNLCSEMSTTCARNCQTFVEQCNLPSGSGPSQLQDGPPQLSPPVADAPPEQNPTIVPIINPSSAPSSQSQQNCKNYKDPCVDHRDCCDFLYCKRFKHVTGAEARLGSCEKDPAKF